MALRPFSTKPKYVTVDRNQAAAIRRHARDLGHIHPSVEASGASKRAFEEWVCTLPKPTNMCVAFAAAGFNRKSQARIRVGAFMPVKLIDLLRYRGMRLDPELPFGVYLHQRGPNTISPPYYHRKNSTPGRRYHYDTPMEAHCGWLRARIEALELLRNDCHYSPAVLRVIDRRLAIYRQCLETGTVYKPVAELPKTKRAKTNESKNQVPRRTLQRPDAFSSLRE